MIRELKYLQASHPPYPLGKEKSTDFLIFKNLRLVSIWYFLTKHFREVEENHSGLGETRCGD